jgi:hypothetical protein
LQWCLMYLTRLSGCRKSSQRDAPSSGISLFGTNVISRCYIWWIRRVVDHSHFSLGQKLLDDCRVVGRFFCSGVKECGTKREQIFLFRTSSTTIFLTVSLPMFTSCASILSEWWRFWSKNWEIFSTLLSSRHCVGRPLLRSSSMSSCPTRNRPYQRKTFQRDSA